MDKNIENETSSSEDEVCLQDIKEAIDTNFLEYSFSKIKQKNINNISNGNNTKESNDNSKVEDIDIYQHQNNGLSQTCKDFIAKKLNKRLNVDIILEDKTVSTDIEKCNSQDTLGIKLFTLSNTVLTKIENVHFDKFSKRKRISIEYDEKANFLKCVEVAIDSKSIISQYDTKHWTNRKPCKLFKYKKLKNGILLEKE